MAPLLSNTCVGRLYLGEPILCFLAGAKKPIHFDELFRRHHDGGSVLLCIWGWIVYGMVPSLCTAYRISPQPR